MKHIFFQPLHPHGKPCPVVVKKLDRIPPTGDEYKKTSIKRTSAKLRFDESGEGVDLLSTIDGQPAKQYLRESVDGLHGLMTTSMNCRIQRTSTPIGISMVKPDECDNRTDSTRGRSGRIGMNIGPRVDVESCVETRLFQYPNEARLMPRDAQKSRWDSPLHN